MATTQRATKGSPLTWTEMDANFQSIDDHIADTADAHDASAISVADSAGIFTGTDVETVLDEIGDRIGSTGPVTFRNRIINGNMSFDQRNAGAAVTPTSSAYTVDRWLLNITQASKLTAQRNGGSYTPPAGFTYYLRILTAAAYSVLAGDSFTLQQPIEGLNVADLSWGTANAKPITLSFWVRSSLTGTFGGAITNGTPNRSYPFSYTISVADTWEFKTISISGDTSGTWATDTSAGIRVYFGLGVGSTATGTAGAWAGADYRSCTGATSVVGTLNATFSITGVQFEQGSVATPFEVLPITIQQNLVQRYCESGNQDMIYLEGISNTAWYGTIRYATTKRTSGASAFTLTGWKYYSAGINTAFTPTVNNDRVDSFTWLGNPLVTANGLTGEGTWLVSCEL